VLYVEDTPWAFWIATLYRETVYLNFTGFDSTYRKFEPGTILFLKMIEDLCKDGEAKEVDFGFGQAFYKERFGDHNWTESSIYVFAPTSKGITLNMMRTMTTAASWFGARVVRRFNLKEKLKRRWRERLRKAKVDEAI
jgi:CelD/BcsL family acetyltransferase involved in cellulose biosynthesis